MVSQLSKENLNKIRQSAIQAGQYILAHSAHPMAPNAVTMKTDGTPVTAVDRGAEDIVYQALHDVAGQTPIIGEERYASGESPKLKGARDFWLIDALDGTKEFIAGTGQYTVNIARIENGVPVYGLIYAPSLGELYEAKQYKGAYVAQVNESFELLTFKKLQPISAPHDLTLITSARQKTSSKLKSLFGAYKIATRKYSGSSIKFCMIASGQADIYPRLGYTSEWDIAAGDAILREVGGAVINLKTGLPFDYGHERRHFLNPGFVALSKAIYEESPEFFKQQS